VLLPYGGSFSNGAILVICAVPAADPSTGSGRSAIATPPSAEAPARNSRLESPWLAVPFMLPPCASSDRVREERDDDTLWSPAASVKLLEELKALDGVAL
jgi:hypothetical protein